MADIKKIKLPGVAEAYDIVDAGARELIAQLESYTDYLGVTSTTITEGSTVTVVAIIGGPYTKVTPVGTENPSEEGWYEYDESTEVYSLTEDTSVVAGKDYFTNKVTVRKGNIVNYGSKEFIFNGSAWAEFGDLSGLGALAYANSVTASYTPAGTMTDPTVSLSGTGTAEAQTITLGGTLTAAGQTITLSGKDSITASKPNVNVTPTTDTFYEIDSVGTAASCTLPTFTVDANGVFEVTAGSFTANTPASLKSTATTFVTGASAELASAPTIDASALSASAADSSVNYASFTATASDSSVSVSGVTATASGTAFTGTAATITSTVPTP